MSQAPRPDLRPARRRLPAKDMDDPEAYRGNTVGENRTAKRNDPTRQPSRPGACVVHHAAAAVEGNKSYRVEQRGDGWRSMKVPRSFNPTTRNYVDGVLMRRLLWATNGPALMQFLGQQGSPA